MISIRKNLWQLLLFDIIASIMAVVRAVNRGKSPSVYFDEGGIMTWLSFIQLLACSGIALRIFQLRLHQLKLNNNNIKSETLWIIVSLGFLFLSIDEILEVHENTDKMILEIFNLPENGLTDRIDDLIVMLYGLIAIALLYFYREELKQYKRAIPTLVWGFTLLFTMTIIDLVSNRNDIFAIFTNNPVTINSLENWFNVIEETLKLLAEALFIGAFCFCLQISRRQFPR